jgi:hypothetical protein
LIGANTSLTANSEASAMTTTNLTLMAFRVEQDMKDQVRSYQRQEEDLPPFSEAVRRLIRLGLRASQKKPQTTS